MKWIKASDIKTWSTNNQRDCASLLPELIRRLLFATASSINSIDFPSGDSIATGGWDGILETNAKSPFFPAGLSGWELGAKSSPGKKAQEDYTKRSKNSLGLPIENTTFVFVTPRPWPNRNKWAIDKKADAKWKNVITVGADNLEQWLEVAPAVSLWLANHLGKAPDGIRDIESFWGEWAATTNPNMTPDLVIAGRESCVLDIQEWLSKPASILSMQGDSPDEPFAFLYSAFTHLSEEDKTRSFARCVIVDTPDQMRYIVQTFNDPLIIVASGECNSVAGLALKKGHHVFLAAGENLLKIGNVNLLSRPRLESIRKSLEASGTPKIEADNISRNSGRSIPVLKRLLSTSPLVTTPPWGNQQAVQILLPILFMGAWQEKKNGDQLIVEKISGKKYQPYLAELNGFLSMDDSPLRKIGDVWMLKSPMDAWFVLSKYLDENILIRYQEILKDVFLQADPKYELPPDKRWAAAIYGKSSSFSEWLRDGLSESLALISVYGDQVTNISSINDLTNQIIKDLLTYSNDWKVWASFDDSMPRFAEASPDTFLHEISKILKKDNELYIALMKDDGDAVFGGCNHSGLLWALESLAWHPIYFSRSVDILFELAKIDPGGRYSNRPINTLKDIFMPRWPQTYASANERAIELDKLILDDPRLAWEFTKGYFSGGSFTEAYRFRWRDYGVTRTGFDPEPNPNNYYGELMPRMKRLACMQENVINALDEFTQLPNDIQLALIDTLEKFDIKKFSKEDKSLILNNIRDAMNRITTYENGSVKKHLKPLNKLLNKFEPDNLLDQVGWLLNNPWPRLPNGDNKNHVENEQEIKRERGKAARLILDKVPVKEILEFASKIQYIGVLGSALGENIKDDEEDNKILDALIGRVKSDQLLISSYAQARINKIGAKWLDKQIKRLQKNKTYNPDIHAVLLAGLPEERSTWVLVESAGHDVEVAYWERARGYCRSEKNEDVQYAVEKLLLVERPRVALEVAGDHRISISSNILRQVILDLLSQPGKLVADSMTDYYLANIFSQLHERKELSDEEIAKLEWPFAPLFRDIDNHTKKPFAIHRLLEKDPALFADLVGMLYKRDDKKPNPKNSDELERLAKNARAVFDSWYGIPGTKGNGNIDENALYDWVKKARAECAKSCHVTGGDLQISSMLAHSPTGIDGIWPHSAVRRIIEDLDNDVINRHIPIEIYNGRGVVSRGLNEGGNQERKLAQNYKEMSERLTTKWPVTASILRGIAESYEHDARREDIDSDLHDIRWN
jgi:hypothetical protein